MNRRGFLTGMLALAAAPAIVKASSLMKIAAPAGYRFEGAILVDDPWSHKTPDEILRDVNDIMVRVWANYSVSPTHIIVPEHVRAASEEQACQEIPAVSATTFNRRLLARHRERVAFAPTSNRFRR